MGLVEVVFEDLPFIFRGDAFIDDFHQFVVQVIGVSFVQLFFLFFKFLLYLHQHLIFADYIHGIVGKLVIFMIQVLLKEFIFQPGKFLHGFDFLVFNLLQLFLFYFSGMNFQPFEKCESDKYNKNNHQQGIEHYCQGREEPGWSYDERVGGDRTGCSFDIACLNPEDIFSYRYTFIFHFRVPCPIVPSGIQSFQGISVEG